MKDRPAAIPLATVEVTLRDAWAVLDAIYALQESAFGNHDRSTAKATLEIERQVLSAATLAELLRRMWLANLALPRADRPVPDPPIDKSRGGGEREDKSLEK